MRRRKNNHDRGRVRENQMEEPVKKKQRGGGVVAHESVPKYIVDALKVNGKSLCIANTLERGCLREPGKCRFEHADLPSDLDAKVMEWIKAQNKKKSQ